MPTRYRLAAVFAHPDDDTWMLAGTYLLGGNDVVLTFGPEGITQHDDHIATSQAATEAFYRAREELGVGGPADASGGPLQRLFYSAVTETDLARMYEAMRAAGQEVDPDAPFMPRAVPDHTITVRVNTSSVADG